MATKKETTKETSKKILLASSNPHLSVFHLGVHFKNGRFETTDRKLANAILKYDGVFEL